MDHQIKPKEIRNSASGAHVSAERPAPPDRPGFGRALLEARTRAALSQADAATALGLPARTYQNYETGTSSPPAALKRQILLSALRALARPELAPDRTPDLPRDPDATPARSPLRTPSTTPVYASGDDADLIVVYGGGEAGAGPPRTNDGIESGPGGAGLDRVVFSRDEIARVIGATTLGRGLCFFWVSGDSMDPELRPGDRAYYSPVVNFASDGFYVVSLDGEWLVKRVQRLGGGVLDLVSVNPAYQTERLRPLPGAEPNTFRSDLTGATCMLSVVGKVVFNLTPR